MPEGPEVRTICDALRPKLVGREVLSVNYWPRASLGGVKQLYIHGERAPHVTHVLSYGKKTLFYLSNGRVIVGSLGMEGSWMYRKGPHSHIQFCFGKSYREEKVTVCVVEIDLFFNDTRYMGDVAIHVVPSPMTASFGGYGGFSSVFSPERYTSFSSETSVRFPSLPTTILGSHMAFPEYGSPPKQSPFVFPLPFSVPVERKSSTSVPVQSPFAFPSSPTERKGSSSTPKENKDRPPNFSGYSLSILPDLGPDILEIELTPHEWACIFAKNGGKKLHDLLLEQKAISGIGNYLKSDICYEARVLPDRRVSSLSQWEVEALRVAAHRIIRESYSYGGLTIKSYWSPDGSAGRYPARVYNRKVDNYGQRIVYEKMGGRGTYYVPGYQV